MNLSEVKLRLRIVEATWEKQNLNKNVLEVTIGKDEPDLNLDEVNNNDVDYIVVKVSCKNSFLTEKLHAGGFVFIENQISLYKHISEGIPPKFNALSQKIELISITGTDDLDALLLNISDDMFSTDRIALDKRFGIRIANHRYRNWIRNEFGKENTELFTINKKDNPIGFVMASLTEHNEVNIQLGGIYTRYQSSGYGYGIVGKPIEHYARLEKKTLKTKVSSNNMDILKIYIAMGYQIEDMEYVWVKHREDNHGF